MWWIRPDTFGPVGNAYGFRQQMHPRPAAHALRVQPVNINMLEVSAHQDPETVVVRSAEPRVMTNTADADITLSYCVAREPTMSAHGQLSRTCAEIEDVGGQHMRVPGGATVMMTVTPHRAGHVVVRGIDIAYARGAGRLWQRGHEITGLVVRVNVTP
jgi:hypothetical protein